MAIERKFIEDSINRHRVAEFLEKELDRAGFSHVEIQRTPMVTRIAVSVTNPGRVIGKRGKTINDLTTAVQREFKIDNPQISVVEISTVELEPRLMAKKAVKMIEMGKNIRRILHATLKMIMDAGALGAEVIASGKIAAKGGRSKRLRVSAGYLPKAGEPSRLVRIASITAYPKSGAIGVIVKIVPPGTEFPDKKKAKKIELPRVIQSAELSDEAEAVRRVAEEGKRVHRKEAAPPAEEKKEAEKKEGEV
ncbi:MAG: 30S ribosomal protein S3, partial [Candidatus Micrarchaeota archaeon]